MLGRQDLQGELFRPDNLFLDFVGQDNPLFTWLALNGPRLFPDDDFSVLYTFDNGRPSVPPSQMMVLVVLQHFTDVSDAEAIACMKFDLRWKVALRLDLEEVLCSKSSLCEFRTALLTKGLSEKFLERSIQACIEAGVLKKRKINVATDTTPILGRGAVKDTYNLLADAIVNLLRAGSALRGEALGEFAKALDLTRYLDCTSIKASAQIDWTAPAERKTFLNELVADAQRALRWARGVATELCASSSMDERLLSKFKEALSLLNRIILQDIEFKSPHPKEEVKNLPAEEVPEQASSGASTPAQAGTDVPEQQEEHAEDQQGVAEIKQGVAKDRMSSVHDPDQRHGRKSKSTRFDGHKGEITVDTDSGVILDASIHPGNASDADGHLASVEASEERLQMAWEAAAQSSPAHPTEGGSSVAPSQVDVGGTPIIEEEGCAVVKSFGDCAYGSAQNRRSFADAGRELNAKQGQLSNEGRYTKDDFPRDPETGQRSCPAQQRADPRPRQVTWNGQSVQVNEYKWEGKLCSTCPLRQQCQKPVSEDGQVYRGRVIRDHPEEELLNQARAQQKSQAFREAYKEREVVEHRIARLVQLGARQSRYFGRAKSGLQWLLKAVIANLTQAAHAARVSFGTYSRYNLALTHILWENQSILLINGGYDPYDCIAA